MESRMACNAAGTTAGSKSERQRTSTALIHHVCRYWLTILLPVLALMVPGIALAACGGSRADSVFTMPSSLTVKRDAPNGTILWDSGGWVGSARATVNNCVPSEDLTWGYYSPMTEVSGMPGVYATNVPGIGIQAYWLNTNAQNPGYGGSPSHLMTSPRSNQGNVGATTFTPVSRFWVRLIKTGKASSGTVSFANPLAAAWYGGFLSNAVTFTNTNIIVNSVTCTTPSVTLDLGTYPSTSLPSVGSVTPGVNFNVNLNNCPGDTTVSYMFTSWEAQSTPGLVAARSANSTSSGVGVRMMWQNDTPIDLSTAYNAFYNTSGNQVTNTGSGGNFTIPMRARMYRMSSGPISPGTVWAEVEFTMWYQ